MGYRKELYDTYVSTHLGSLKTRPIEVLREQLEKQRIVYRAYFSRFLPNDKDAPILDIGCGYGAFLYFLQREGYRDTRGVDNAPEQVEITGDLGIPNVQCIDILEFLGQHPCEFRCITALDVVEHFRKEEVLPLLHTISDALKSGGAFIMQSSNAAGPFGANYRYSDFTHELSFTKRSVTQVLATMGFTDIEVVPTGPVVHGINSGIRWLLWRFVSALFAGYLAIETGSFRGHILTQDLIAVARKPVDEGRPNG